jgi:biotin carboxyl carrier protein
MKYHVSVGGRNLVVEIDGDVVLVEGKEVVASAERLRGTPEIRVTIDGATSSIVVEAQEGRTWRLIDQGAVRDVDVEDERSRHIRLLASLGRAEEGPAALKAPMPGLVVRVLVQAGTPFVAGTPLLALEAMKMENELKATGPGVVTAVLVTAGQAVEKGQHLLELGPPPPAE